MSEQLDATLAMMVEASKHPCFVCGGKAQIPIAGTEPVITVEDGSIVHRFQTEPCPVCKLGTIETPATHPSLFGGVLGSVVRIVLRERAASRFGYMNEALDWAQTYMDASVVALSQDAEMLAAIEEAIPKLGEAAERLDRPTIRPSGGLTDDELRELDCLPPAD